MTIRWWMPLAAGVTVVSLALGTLIWTSVRVRPQKVEDHPYAESAHEDARRAEREAFAARGCHLLLAVDGDGVTATLDPGRGADIVRGTVTLYRPDDEGADVVRAWQEPCRPVRILLNRKGIWSFKVELRTVEGQLLLHEERITRP